MNIQRFTGATSREALAKARHAFGDGTLILSNRQTPLGVEVMATTEDSVSTLDVRAHAPAPRRQQLRQPRCRSTWQWHVPCPSRTSRWHRTLRRWR